MLKISYTMSMKMTKSFANSFKTFGRSFLLCGLCGWCMEILFTALHSLRRRDLRLTGNTSLWMFPIYGSACLLAPFKRLFEHLNISRPGRGLFYMAMIFTVEYLSGRLLWKHGLSPGITVKAVSTPPDHPAGLCSLVFLAGLFFEKILP